MINYIFNKLIMRRKDRNISNIFKEKKRDNKRTIYKENTKSIYLDNYNKDIFLLNQKRKPPDKIVNISKNKKPKLDNGNKTVCKINNIIEKYKKRYNKKSIYKIKNIKQQQN